MNLTITADGRIRGIYSDDLTGIIEQGTARIERASHVEPFAGGGWYADMRPSDGPVLFGGDHFITLCEGTDVNSYVAMNGAGFVRGFATRAEALAAEVSWLEKNRGL